jgi:NADH-quinone oxidoreductase subunit L
VTADSYLMMFVGWEGVGLCSYLLISFWFEGGLEGLGNAIAGKKAFVVNRIGDVGFLLAMFVTYWTFGSLNFDTVFHQAESMGAAAVAPVTVITLLLLLGVTGKSAQLPLFVWLPDAMAGPTPVSALIHAATMVTAGIYLVARNHVLFALAPVGANTAAMIGALTALFSATIAVAQFDIKKVLAYSTISQLGFMLAAVGLGGYVAGLFHLVTHAFFKALLFLGAGSVIQGVEHAHDASDGDHGHDHAFDPQDMRNMGGLSSRMKTTFWVYLIAALSLAGVPPLSGFFSKDEILLDAFHANPVVYGLLAVAAFLTAFYIGRQLFMVFGGAPRTSAAKDAKENPPVMTLPLVALAVLAAVGGALNFPGLHPLASWLKLSIAEIEIHPFDYQVAGISTAIALVALFAAWWVYGRKPLAEGVSDPLRSSLGALFSAMASKWWVDELYAATVVRGYEGLAALMVVGEDAQNAGNRFWTAWLDQLGMRRGGEAARGLIGMIVDLSFVDSFMITSGDLARSAAQRLSGLQTGFIRNYALAILLGILGVMALMLFGAG